jgi:subtilisin family serine protease
MHPVAPTLGALLAGALSSIALTATAAPPVAARSPQAQQPGAFAPGRIIVVPRAGLRDGDVASALGEVRGRGRRLGGSGLHIVEVPAGTEHAAAERMSRHRHMKFAEVDWRIGPDLVTNDPYYGSAWHLPVISAPNAWDRTLGKGVIIAILDSGVDGTHPDLASRLVPGWNVYDNNADTTDVYGHGTKVAGAAAASSNNAAGVAGVAGQAAIMPIRVTDTSGYAYTSTLVQGLTWAADHGARVANISFEAAGMSSVITAANYMRSKNGLVTVSAGNSGALSSTAPTTAMIPVSATGSSDTLASWSNYGNVIAMAAPGVSIYTTLKGGSYGKVSGTSFAAPVTAGTIALMMAAQPTLSNTAIEKLLYSSATDLGATGRDIYFGYGRVNAGAAVQAAVAAVPAVDTIAPTVSISAPLASSTVSGLVSVDTVSSDNVGIVRAELRVNGATVATDTSAPFAFSWDSTKVANGMASLAVVAYDAAGNSKTSTAVAVNVANTSTTTTSTVDKTKPVITIFNPTDGSKVSGNVSISVKFSDNSGSAALRNQRLSINGTVVARSATDTLTYTWNTTSLTAGSFKIKASASDAAGNVNSALVTVSVQKL